MSGIRLTGGTLVVLALSAAAGCEGFNRRNHPDIDLSTPPDVVVNRSRESGTHAADLLEQMMQARQDYLARMTRLEQHYLDQGDMVRSNWARRQRDLTERVMVYPFATDTLLEDTAMVSPDESIPDANKMYDEAKALYDSFRGLPLAGALEVNKKKARQAIGIWRELINKHPRSDKVDDAAFLIGECYKEYLREEDMDNQLALRYYDWAVRLNPRLPWPARFQAAVVHDYRMHDRTTALVYYRSVLEENEDYSQSNLRWSAERIRELTDEAESPHRPRDRLAPQPSGARDSGRAVAGSRAGDIDEEPSGMSGQ